MRQELCHGSRNNSFKCFLFASISLTTPRRYKSRKEQVPGRCSLSVLERRSAEVEERKKESTGTGIELFPARGEIYEGIMSLGMGV